MDKYYLIEIIKELREKDILAAEVESELTQSFLESKEWSDEENPDTFERIKAKLDLCGVPYKLTTHEPVLTS